MKTRSIVILAVLGIGGACAVVVAGCAGFIFFAFSSTGTMITPRVEALFAAIDREEDQASYDRDFTPDYRGVTTFAQHQRICQLVRLRLGKLQSQTLTSTQLHHNNGTSTADVVYSANFEKGAATIKAKLQKVGDDWLYLGFRVDSPAFLPDLTEQKCPHCGAAHEASARFCPSCGKPLSTDEPAAGEDEPAQAEVEPTDAKPDL
ncbi:MAG: zinc-ribbon domain-containing protein [Pirellulales bacterium]